MSDVKYNELKKNDDVIFARILPKLNIYETINLHIASIFATHCIGIDPKTKKRTRIGHTVDKKGNKVRCAKKSNESID